MIRYNYKSKDGVFFTSDTHFGHTNILKYCDRPFSSTEEMDEEIIRCWNSVVKPDNIVFHLGDFAFGTIAQWETYRNRLNGHIHLILGNHDMHNFSNSRQRLEEMFESVQFQALIEVGNSKI
jgi:calcineurin-like phosphoesterase family protein